MSLSSLRPSVALTLFCSLLFASAQAAEATLEDRAAVHWVAQEIETARVLDAVSQRAVRGAVIYRDVSVIDVVQSRVVPHQSVLVDDGRISWVGDAPGAPEAKGAFVVDGAGLYLSPGIVDMHVHTESLSEQLMRLACGNTTVREMDGFPWMLRLRQAVQAGRLLAPTTYISGTIIADHPFGSYTVVVKTEAEARHVVDQQVAFGYDFIKVHNRLDEPLFDAVADEARRKGKDLVGHVPHGISIDHAVHSGGMRTLEHLKGFIYDGNMKVSSEDYAAALKGAQVWLTPTFSCGLIMDLSGEEARRALARPEMRYVSTTKLTNWALFAQKEPDWRERLTKSLPAMLSGLVPQSMKDRIRVSTPAAMARLLPLHPRWLAGTDSAGYNFQIPGYEILGELVEMGKQGIARAEVLRAATSEPAIAMRREGEFGQVKVGMRADFVLLAGDPTKDLSIYHTNRGVMVHGVWLDRANLDAALDDLARIKAETDEAFALDAKVADTLVSETLRLSSQGIGLDPMMLNPAIDGLRNLGFATAADKLKTADTAAASGH